MAISEECITIVLDLRCSTPVARGDSHIGHIERNHAVIHRDSCTADQSKHRFLLTHVIVYLFICIATIVLLQRCFVYLFICIATFVLLQRCFVLMKYLPWPHTSSTSSSRYPVLVYCMFLFTLLNAFTKLLMVCPKYPSG